MDAQAPRRVRRRTARWLGRRGFGDRSTLGADLRAGTVLGIESVPDGLAAGVLAGVSPVAGLYGYMVGTIAGALSTSSVFMSVQATGAMAVIIADVPQVRDDPSGRMLATLALLTGVVLLLAGLARLGQWVRFVSNSVLIGFVNAVAISIVLGQVDNVTGYAAAGPNKIARLFDALVNARSFDRTTIAVGALTVLLIVVFERTRLGALGMVAAVVVGSTVVAVLGLGSVTTVADITTVPRTLPIPMWPDFTRLLGLLVPAVSLAFVAAVQGAAISASVPNPDGEVADASGDFRGQGVANIATGFLQGMPVGGSMSATSLVRKAGARSRTANVCAAVVMAAAVVVVPGLIGRVAMPALGALLMVVGVRTSKPAEAYGVWRTGRNHAAAMMVTFVLTLLIPLQYAVLIGVAVSITLHVVRQANHFAVVRWVLDDRGRPTEVDCPAAVGRAEVLVLAVYGSLFFASAPLLRRLLPAVDGHTGRSVVILRLRGQDTIGSTAAKGLEDYAGRLAAAQSRLVLVGIAPHLQAQLGVSAVLTGPAVTIHPARPHIGGGLRDAVADAEHWIHESMGARNDR